MELVPWLWLSTEVTTKDKQQQQEKHEPVSQQHSCKHAAHHSDYLKYINTCSLSIYSQYVLMHYIMITVS